MVNNYEVGFSLREIIKAFFSRENLVFENKMKYRYELGSGRDCIFLCLKDIEKEQGRGEVICPNYSCKAIPKAIIKAGFTPVFVDVDKTISMDSKELNRAIKSCKNLKAIIFYHPWGFEHSIKIPKKNKIRIIEDCAQILGKSVGNWGDYSFFSFRTSKLISAGSGAILFSKEKIGIPLIKNKMQIIDFIDLCFRKIKNYSRFRAVFENFEGIGNRKMGSFQKNLLAIELRSIDEKIKKRVKNYNFLRKVITKTKNFKNIDFKNHLSPLYFPVLCKQKNKAINLFNKNKINATPYYNFVNSDVFKSRFFANKNSNYFAKNLLNLPLHEYLDELDMEKIKEGIMKIDKELG
jgi:dTDP-4-amino-4,6-dideoxygalactose transaminase